MNLDERTALMNRVRHRLRPANKVLSEDEIASIKIRLMDYAIMGRSDDVGSLAHTAWHAADALGFLQFDLMDALNEIKRLSDNLTHASAEIRRLTEENLLRMEQFDEHGFG